MKLSTWAKLQGVTYRTAWNLYKSKKLVGYQLPTGTIIIPDETSIPEGKTVVYARVSSSENKSNLESQAQRVSQFCNARGWVVSQVVKECASGLNDQRPKLLQILQDKSVSRIVVEHKDRLTRFGFNYLTLLPNKELVVINQSNNCEDDLMSDFVSLVTCFAARLYGKRRSQRKTEAIIKALENE